jgi:hypothetical protein
LAVDRGPATNARIRPSVSSNRPPFLAAAKVLEHAASPLGEGDRLFAEPGILAAAHHLR